LRKILIAALAALTALAAVAVASAQEQQAPGAEMTISVSPSKVGTKKKPKPAKISLEIDNADSSQTADGLRIFHAKQIAVSTTGLKKCSAAKLEEQGKSACPAASRLGRGTADAVAGVNTPAPAELKFNVTAFLLGTNKLGFYLEQQGGEIRVLAKGTFKKASGQYGRVLDVDIPQLAREFPDGVYNGLDRLETTLYKKIGRNSLYKTTGCTSARTLPFKAEISFQSNPGPPKASEVEALAAADCRK
jgi:hypothetical protein